MILLNGDVIEEYRKEIRTVKSNGEVEKWMRPTRILQSCFASKVIKTLCFYRLQKP